MKSQTQIKKGCGEEFYERICGIYGGTPKQCGIGGCLCDSCQSLLEQSQEIVGMIDEEINKCYNSEDNSDAINNYYLYLRELKSAIIGEGKEDENE